MSCRICKRSSCTESFHSLEEQDLFAQRETMPDDTDLLRRMAQEGAAEILDLKGEVSRLKAHLENAADALDNMGNDFAANNARKAIN